MSLLVFSLQTVVIFHIRTSERHFRYWACCDTPFTLQTATSVTATLFHPQKCSTRKQKSGREQAWGQKLMALMLNVTTPRPGSQHFMPSFLIYYWESCCVTVCMHLWAMTPSELELLLALCQQPGLNMGLAIPQRCMIGEGEVWCKLLQFSAGI